jgi:hypothetical protein
MSGTATKLSRDQWQRPGEQLNEKAQPEGPHWQAARPGAS